MRPRFYYWHAHGIPGTPDEVARQIAVNFFNLEDHELTTDVVEQALGHGLCVSFHQTTIH